MSLAGALFLIWYGSLAAKEAFLGTSRLAISNTENGNKSLKAALTMAFAMTFLNPHVYIDTVLLVGGVTASLETHLKPWFVCGALLASATWFYSLVFVAKRLANVLNKPKAWRIINSLIAALMYFIAAKLVLQAIDAWA